MKKILAILFILSLLPVASFAQYSSDQIEKRFEQSAEPKATLEKIFPKIEDSIPPEEAEKIVFTLTNISLDGGTIYDDSVFLDLYKDMIGEEVSLFDVYTIVNRITQRYGNDGYLLSRAYLPEQTVKDGVVKIAILEGFITDVVYEGQFRNERNLLAEYKNKITSERPAQSDTIERYLLLASDLNGVEVSSTLKPSENTPGGSVLIIEVKEDIVSGSLGVDNRGTKASGPTQIFTNLSLSNPLGLFSKTTLLYATAEQTQELQFILGEHKQVLNSEGTAAHIKASSSTTQAGRGVLKDLDHESTGHYSEVGITHPFIRSRGMNLSVGVSFGARDQETSLLSETISLDRTRVLHLTSAFDYADTYSGISQVLLDYSHGFDALGATPDSSTTKTRSDGDAEFNKLKYTLSRTQRLDLVSAKLARWSLYTALDGQFSGNALLTSEEYSIGGSRFGRAYDSSEIIGDDGIAATIELQHLLDYSNEYVDYIQLYGFWDTGTTTNRRPTESNAEHRSLSSAGGGARFSLSDRVTGSIELAQPLTREVANEGNDHLRGFAEISVKF